jgi:tetratricopeptide (TPR) repeat protein
MSSSHRWDLPKVLALTTLAAGGPVLAGSPARAVAVQTAAPAAAPIAERLARVRNDVLTGQRLAESIPELHRILAAEPQLAEAHVLLGLAHAGGGDREMLGEAVAEFRQALELDASLVAARFYLARVYIDMSQPERARDEMQIALKALPNQPQFLSVLGEAERLLGDAAKAADLQRQAIATDASFAQARYYLGLAQLDLGQHADAVANFEGLLKSGVTVPDVFFGLGAAYLATSRPAMAINALVDGLKQVPARHDMRLKLVRAYRLTGALAKADEQLKLTLPQGTPMQASSFYQELQRDIHLETGLLRAQQKQLTAAVAAFKSALDIDPAFGPAHRELATVYRRLGQPTLAAAHEAEARRLGSAAPPAAAGGRGAGAQAPPNPGRGRAQ